MVLTAGAVCLLLAAAGGVYLLGDTLRPPAADDEPNTSTFPPGVSTNGVTDARTLVDAHQRALRNTSIAYTHATRVAYANGTHVANWTTRYDIGPRNAAYLFVQTANGTLLNVRRPDRWSAWSNGSVTVSCLHRGNESTYRRGTLTLDLDIGGRLYDVFTGLNTTLDEQTVGAPFTVNADGVTDARVLSTSPALQNPRNVTLTATITERGVVESYRLAYDATLQENRVHVVERYELAGVDIQVTEPDWVDEALRRTAE